MKYPSSHLDRRSFLAALAAAGAAGAAPSVFAQAESTGPLRLIVPYTPGTGHDQIARQVGPRLTERLKRPVVIDNRPGAAGNIGTLEAVRAPADGSTLLITGNTLVMNRALYAKPGFDPLKDLEPITLASWGTLLLVTSRKSGIKSMQDLVSKAKAEPGKLNYGSPGPGTPHHLAMELVKKQAGIDLTHVPYGGTGPAVTDILGGTLDVMFLPIHVALQHVKAGALNALAISSANPSPLLPNVPPLRQLNMGDLDVEMWYGVLAPKGTPKAIIDKFNAEFGAILALPEIKTAFEAQGMTPAHDTPEDFGRLMVKDAARWAEVIRVQKITAN